MTTLTETSHKTKGAAFLIEDASAEQIFTPEEPVNSVALRRRIGARLLASEKYVA